MSYFPDFERCHFVGMLLNFKHSCFPFHVRNEREQLEEFCSLIFLCVAAVTSGQIGWVRNLFYDFLGPHSNKICLIKTYVSLNNVYIVFFLVILSLRSKKELIK